VSDNVVGGAAAIAGASVVIIQFSFVDFFCTTVDGDQQFFEGDILTADVVW